MDLLVGIYDIWLEYYAKKEAGETLRSLVRSYEESLNIADNKGVSCAETHASDATKELTKLIQSVKPVEDTNL